MKANLQEDKGLSQFLVILYLCGLYERGLLVALWCQEGLYPVNICKEKVPKAKSVADNPLSLLKSYVMNSHEKEFMILM